MVMALGSKEEKLSKQCKILKDKIIRKEKLILLLKELVQVKDKTTHEHISQQLLALRARSQESTSSLKKELLLNCNSTKEIVQLQDANRKTMEELSSSLENKRGTIAHLEFQNKQLVIVEHQHKKTIETLKESLKTLEKKSASCNCVFKSRGKKSKDKRLEDTPPTPASSVSSCPETSKPSSQQNFLTEGILTPASSIASSISVADGLSNPGMGWLDLDSRSNSPTPSLPEVFRASHDPVAPEFIPIQSAANKPLHDDQSMPLLSEYGHCPEQLDGCSKTIVEDPQVVVNPNNELTNSDESSVTDRLSPKSQSISVMSIFDLPLNKPEYDDVRSGSKKEDASTKHNPEISFLNSFGDSFCNDLALSDSSELDSELNLAASDMRKPDCNNSENQVRNPTSDPPKTKEFDKPEATDGDGLKQLLLPSVLDFACGSDLPQVTSLIEPQSNVNPSELENQTPCQGISDTDLIEETFTAENATSKELRPSDNLTLECAESSVAANACDIDIRTQTNAVIGQSTGEQEFISSHPTKEVEVAARVHSPIPAFNNNGSNDDASPGMSKDEELLSSNERPTSSSSLCKPKPSFTSTAQQLDSTVDPENDSSSSPIGGNVFKNYSLITRSKSITPKNTPQKVTKRKSKELMNTVGISSKKSTRETRQNSNLHTPERRRSSRNNSSVKTRPLEDCVADSLISPRKLASDNAEVASTPERLRASISLENASSNSPSTRRKAGRKTSSQKPAANTLSPTSICSRHQTDMSGEVTVSSTMSDTHQELFEQLLVEKKCCPNATKTYESLLEPEVRDSASVEIHSSDPNSSCMQNPNEEKFLLSRHEIVISPDFIGFEDTSSQTGSSQLAVEDLAREVVPPLHRSPTTDSPLGQIKGNVPKAVQPSSPIMRKGKNTLCSVGTAVQTFSSTFSKSFDSNSTMFGAQNLPSFSDLKKPLDIRSPSDQFRSGGAFSPRDSIYSNYRQGKNVDKQPSHSTHHEDDVDNLRVGQLCLSFSLLSINPSPNNKNDSLFNFFIQFKKEKTDVNESSLFLQSHIDNHGLGDCSDCSKFTTYRNGAGHLNETLDTNSEVTIEIKQEDSPFSMKLSMPAGKPLEPIFGSLCNMVRELQTKNAPFASCQHLPGSSTTDSGSSIPVVGESPESFRRPITGVFEPKHSANFIFPDRAIRPQSNERFNNANHKFKPENKTLPSCQWVGDVIKRPSFSRVVSPNLRCNSTFSTSKSNKSQSDSNKFCQSHFQLKASRLVCEAPSICDDSNKEVNHVMKGVTPTASPTDTNSVVFPTLSSTHVHQTAVHSQVGSESYHGLPDSKSLDLPFDSAEENRNSKAVNCVATVNSSTSPVSLSDRLLEKFKSDVAVDSTAFSKNCDDQGQCNNMARMNSNVNSSEVLCDIRTRSSQFEGQQPVADDPPNEHSKLPSIPLSQPENNFLPEALSSNLKSTSSACENLYAPVKGNSKKRSIVRSVCKDAVKPKKRCLGLTEGQKSEAFIRQSCCKLTAAGSPKKVDIDVMKPPATPSLPCSHVSPDQKRNDDQVKLPRNVKRKVTRRVSPKKLSVETIAVSKTDAKALNVEGVIKEDTCPQCQRETATCSCEIERIVKEMTHFCSAPLSPIRDPESDDLESTLPCDEPAKSGGLEKKKISETMDYIKRPIGESLHDSIDSCSVQTCSSQSSCLSTNELGMLEGVANEEEMNDTQVYTSENGLETRQIVSNYEMNDSEELRVQAIDPPTEKTDGPIGETENDSAAVEKCAEEDTSFCALTNGNYLETREIFSSNDGVGDSRYLEKCKLDGSVGEAETSETCGTQEGSSIGNRKRRRKTYELNMERRSGRKRKGGDGIKAVNNLNVENCTPDVGNSKNYMYRKKNPIVDELREVPTGRSAVPSREQCELNGIKDVTAKNGTDVLSNIPELETSKQRQNSKPTALKRARIGQVVRRTRKRRSVDSENCVESDQVVGLAPSAAAENHPVTQPGCLEFGEQSVEPNNILDVEDHRGYDDENVAKSTDSRRDADRNEANQRKSAAREIDKSVDKLLESISTVSGSQQTRNGHSDHREKSQPVGSHTSFNPLIHLGKFFERASSTFQPASSSVGGPHTNIMSRTLPSESDDDSESEMVVDFGSFSESEPKETLLTSQHSDDHEPSVSSAIEYNKPTSTHSNTARSHQPGFYVTSQQSSNYDGISKPTCSKPINSYQSTLASDLSEEIQLERQPGFYVTSQRNDSDKDKKPTCSKPINSCQSAPTSEPSLGMQLPNFYTKIDESEIAPQDESEPKRLIKISHINKIVREDIRKEDIVPCSINMLAFASFYELGEPVEKLKLPEPYKKHQGRIENCLNEFFLCHDLEEGLKKAVSTLHKMKPCHIGNALCAVVGESNPKIQDYERTGIASFFTKIQKKAVLLVTALAKGRFVYFNDVLSEIEEFLIPSPKSPAPNLSHATTNLASLYALICRTQGFGVRVQSFIYDLLYGRHISSFKIINQILLTIPQVIPWAQEAMGPLTYTIVYLIMKHGIYQNLTPQYLFHSGVTPLRNRLTTKYRYSFSPDLTRETVMDELMSNVMVKGCDKAIVLLSKSQGYKWTYTVVQKHIFPVIDKWIIGEGDEDYVIAIIKLLGLMSRCFAISVCESFVSSSLENLKRIIQKNPSLPVAEAVTDALVHFKRLNPEGVITILANWTPHDYKITKSCVRTLKNITKSKPYSYWKQFMT